MKEIDHINKWNYIPGSWIGRITVVKKKNVHTAQNNL